MAHYQIVFEQSGELWDFDARCLTKERITTTLHSSIFNLVYFTSRREIPVYNERIYIFRDGKLVLNLLALLHETFPEGSMMAQTFYWPAGRFCPATERCWKVKSDRFEGVHV